MRTKSRTLFKLQSSVTRLGKFLKVLGNNFHTKVSQICGYFFKLFLNTKLSSKNCNGYILGNFGITLEWIWNSYGMHLECILNTCEMHFECIWNAFVYVLESVLNAFGMMLNSCGLHVGCTSVANFTGWNN